MDSTPSKINEKSLQFVRQLIDKTEKGLIHWTPGFEDGQFKTVLGDGKLAFVVQVKGDVRIFLLLDEHQEKILEEELSKRRSVLAESRVNDFEHGHSVDEDAYCEDGKTVQLYDEIGRLQELARTKALKVDQRLAQAEEILASLQ